MKLDLGETKKLENVCIMTNGIMVSVKPFLSSNEKRMLIKCYVDELFATDDFAYNISMAEEGLILGVIDVCTDIKLVESDDVERDIDIIVNTGIWKDIEACIPNYEIFVNELRCAVDLAKADRSNKAAVGAVVQQLVDKLLSFAETLPKDILSEKGMQDILGKLSGEVDVLKNRLETAPSSVQAYQQPSQAKKGSHGKGKVK